MPVAPKRRRMGEIKQCVRCERAIDAYARICPFCNWDQSEVPPPPVEQPATVPEYVPPPQRSWRRYIFTGAGGVILLIAAFVVGFLVHGNEPPRNAPEPISKRDDVVRPAPRADVTLIPVNDTSPIEQPITSAPALNPAAGVPNEYQRSDATAVSSAEYAQLAERARAEKKTNTSLLDPRSLTGPAYAQGQRASDDLPAAQSLSPSLTGEPARIIISTRPVPRDQPLPDIKVSEPITARLKLTIGADGHVKEVDVVNGIPGQTSRIIETVQKWRFKPATENGVPVEAPYSVDLSFQPDE